MSRAPRFLITDRPAVYHVVSRTALPGYPIGEAERDFLLQTIRQLGQLFFVEVLGFCIMGNHFHLAVKVWPESEVDDQEVKRRYKAWYGSAGYLSEDRIRACRSKWTDLSEYVKSLKQRFSRYYNKRRGRRGYFWAERYTSVLVQEGRTLVNLLAYIDLNPVRAGLVGRPEDYRWCSLGHHLRTSHSDELLSVDFGLREWAKLKPREIVRRYREFVYETGAVDVGKGAVIEERIVRRERRRKYRISRVDRFRHRTRYFTDAGIIGSKEFVGEVFDRIKHLLASKNERRFTPVDGLDGVYSMKRLT